MQTSLSTLSTRAAGLALSFVCLASASAQSTQIQKRPSAGLTAAEAQPDKSAASPTATYDSRRPRRALDLGLATATTSVEQRLPDLTPDYPLWDDGTEVGCHWVVGTNYKARFGADGATFVPYFGSAAPRNWPVTFRLREATVGGAALPLADAATLARSMDQVDLDRGSVTARYHARAGSIEQTFVFEELPRRGEIEVRVAIDSDLTATATREGFSFEGPLGSVTYGRAIAIDADGRRIELQSRLESTGGSQQLVHRVPPGFVAAARLPLVIDPVVTTIGFLSQPPAVGDVDLGYEPTTDTYMAAWVLEFSGTDRDAYVAHFTATGDLVLGSNQPFDISSADTPSVSTAGKAVSQAFLVAVQYRGIGQADTEIRTRTRGAVPPYANAIWGTVSGAESGSKVSPDVGGDYNTVGPTYWTVVWQRNYSPTDRDVHARQVGSGNLPRGNGTIFLDNSLEDDITPDISESCGDRSFSSQDWGVVWRRDVGGTDIFGRFVHWNGTLTGGVVPLVVDGERSLTPSISSPTQLRNGQRYFALAWAHGSVKPQRNIGLALIDTAGTVWDDIEFFAPNQASARAPEIDCDGQRFTVTFELPVSGGFAPQAAAFSLGIERDLTLRQLEPARVMNSVSVEIDEPAIAARYQEPSGLHFFESLIAWDETSAGGGMSSLAGARFEAVGPPAATRDAIGCGQIDIAAASLYVPGSELRLIVTGDTGPHGILIGQPLPVPVPCGSCNLAVQGTSFAGDLIFDLPLDAGLVGLQAAAQGYQLTGGDCVGFIQLTDRVNFTVR